MSTLGLRFGELGGCPRQLAGHGKGHTAWRRKGVLPEIYARFLAGEKSWVLVRLP